MKLFPGDVVVSTGSQEYIVAVATEENNSIVLQNVYGYWKSKYSDPEAFERYHGMCLVARAPKGN